MKYIIPLLISIFVFAGGTYLVSHWDGQLFGATIITTNTTDTIETFRTNVNTSLTNLNNALNSGASATWALDLGYLHPTTSVPIIVNNATSTITNLVMVTSTTTGATTTSLSIGSLAGTLFSTSGVVRATSSLSVLNGGTGVQTFGQGWLFSNGASQALAASTSPTVNFLIATSSTATSTFPFLAAVNRLAIPNGGSLTTVSQGQIGIDTTTGQVRYNVDGTNSNVLLDEREVSAVIGTTTLSYLGPYAAAGTTTLIIWIPKRAVTITDFYCDSFGPAGTSTFRIGNGSASSTYGVCGEDVPLSISSIGVSVSARSPVYMDVGTLIGAPGYFTTTITSTENSD